MQHIAIIGGGLCGAVTAINLLRSGQEYLVTVFEKERRQFLKGPAYSSTLPHQLLNVPAMAMSLFDEAPDDFTEWIREKGLHHRFKATDFVPRSLFGEYVEDRFEVVRNSADSIINTEFTAVSGIEKDGDGWLLLTGDGRKIFAHQVILCFGNLPPRELSVTKGLNTDPFIINNPWEGSFLKEIRKDDEVLIVGSGLTMVDIVLSLHRQGHEGKISVLSRRGYLPHPHGAAPVYGLKLEEKFNTGTALGILSWLRAEAKLAQMQGASWISVINAIRDLTPGLWQALPEHEKQRFLRHLKPFWEIHRHRVPGESLDLIMELQQEGKLNRIAGRIVSIRKEGSLFQTSYHPRGSKQVKECTSKWLINCTGPDANPAASGNVLVSQLLRAGIIVPDATGTGLELPSGTKGIYLAGPPAKGTYWECTALREIRQHAVAICEFVAKAAIRNRISIRA